MESKRLEKKLNSIFWFVLTTLPLILLIFIYIFSLPKYASAYFENNTDWFEFIEYSLSDSSIFDNAFTEFDNMSIPFIYRTFYSVFNNTFEVSSPIAMSYLFGWMLSIQVYHLIYDVLKFIIHWCHSLIEKAYI